MLFNRDINTWNNIVNQTYDIEFDFIAIDNCDQIGIFSTFNRSYRPECVLKSFDQYLLLDKFMEMLPKTTSAYLVKQDENMLAYADWKHYAELGLFAYDNQDVHRIAEDKKHQYDIIFRPNSPLHLSQVSGLNDYLNIIPRFDLDFGNNIEFGELQATLIE